MNAAHVVILWRKNYGFNVKPSLNSKVSKDERESSKEFNPYILFDLYSSYSYLSRLHTVNSLLYTYKAVLSGERGSGEEAPYETTSPLTAYLPV